MEVTPVPCELTCGATRRATEMISISTGLSLGPARCALILQPYDSENLQREFPSILLEIEQGRVPSNAVLPFVARSLVDTPDGLIVVDRLGEVVRICSDETFDEVIDRPDEFGFLGEARSIAGRVYVVGMRRQVYVRDNTGRWSRAVSRCSRRSINGVRLSWTGRRERRHSGASRQGI
jgi:hypothetical protein